ncbi:MAG: 2-C-methyl-D-erythritol 4-phosphate cytidylyltransferase [Actinomycetota bacterium]
MEQRLTASTPVALVLAAGKGSRVGADRPKQLLELLGKPVFVHALEQHAHMGHHIVMVVSDSTREPIEEGIAEHLAGAAIDIVLGGSTRRDSVIAGIEAIPDITAQDTAVFLRNAASPNVPDDVVQGCIDGLIEHDGMQAYVRSNETTFIRAHGNLDWLIARDITGFTVDPTSYRRSMMEGLAQAMRDGNLGETTLDMARNLHANIGLVESPRTNFKFTTKGDLRRLEAAMLDPESFED